MTRNKSNDRRLIPAATRFEVNEKALQHIPSMPRLWPLNLPVTKERIAEKCAELLGRQGEWTAWEEETLRFIAEHAQQCAEIHDHIVSTAELWSQRAEDLALLLIQRFDERHIDHPEEHWDYTIDDVMKSQLWTSGEIAIGLAEELSRSTLILDDLSESDLPFMIVDRIVDLDLARRGSRQIAKMERIVDAFTEIADEPYSDEPIHDRLLRRAVELAQASDNARMRRLEAGRLRNKERIARAVAAACDNLGVPTPLRPHFLDNGEDEVQMRWYPDALNDQEGRLRALRPNGRENLNVDPNAIGDLDPYIISWLVGFMQRTLLLIGRDYEIDAQEAPLSEPPAWSWAAPLPIARYIAASPNRRYLFASGQYTWDCGILQPSWGITLGEDRAVELQCEILTEGTWFDVDFKTILPETIRTAMTGMAGRPVRDLVSHPCLDDDRITIAAIRPICDEKYRIWLDAPVVRIAPWPEWLEINADPVAAWMAYGRAMDAPEFYRRQHRTTGQFLTWEIR